jgi:hypothetical protein
MFPRLACMFSSRNFSSHFFSLAVLRNLPVSWSALTQADMVESPLGIEACSCFSFACDFRLMVCDGPIPDARTTKCQKIGRIENSPLLSLILTEENMLTNLTEIQRY